MVSSDAPHGLLLAAGRGSRMGTPKALLRESDGRTWLDRAVRTLTDGGCSGVTVVLGASADDAMQLVPDGVSVVVADDWSDGLSASLAAGLAVLPPDPVAAMVHLVDLPDVTAEVVRRVACPDASPQSLARAVYDGRPGHPVLIGRDHWAPIRTGLSGDSGARAYLDSPVTALIECGDLATGQDVDVAHGRSLA